ncbi:MAG: cysteine--tRNA ligase [Nitriliruptoraceae bacterium]
MSLVLYDTLQRAEVPFVPRDDGRVAMYACGPTVQADAHVGHGRLMVVSDLLRRYLRYLGYAVTYVQNVTDIDDKIILRARREQVDPAVIATRFTQAWNRTVDALGALPPDIQPFATGHLLEMQELIQTLLEQDKAYAVDGDVFFRVRTFPDYGKLSRRRIDELEQGEDVVDADRKEDPLDFAMWKSAKPGEPSWPSPWGPGRPGWHIECSVMATKHLGAEFDIHCGGLDLVFPHHENEIAQFEAAESRPFARHWIHNGMVQMGDEKMSKSVGNVVSLADAVDAWGRGPMRLWYLSAQHRTPLTFDEERLSDASAAFARLVTFVRAVRRAAGVTAADADADAGAPHRAAFEAAMDDDLNAPAAIAALHDLVSAGNDLLADVSSDATAAAAVAGLADTLVELADDVLGLGIDDELDRAAVDEARMAPLVEELLEQRRRARNDRDFAAADAIRDRLADAGVVVEDQGTTSVWYVANRGGAET